MLERQLVRYFVAVADHGSFTRAAQQCGVSQPTLSVGIARLEGEVGAPLFNRTNRRVEMTAAGTRFAPHARRIEAEFAAAERAVREDPPTRLIRIGVTSTLPADWLEDALVAAAGTGEQIELAEGRMRELLPMLDRGRIDAVIGPMEAGRGEPLFTEPYSMTLPAHHPLATREQVGAEELADEPMIVRRHCEALPQVSRHFTDRGVRPFMAARTSNDERAIGFVRSGLGVTVMPRCFGREGIAMPLLAGFGLTRTIGVLTDPASTKRLATSPGFDRFRGWLQARGAGAA